MLTALFMCHDDPSIISRESIHKHNFGQALKVQSDVVTVKIRSMSLKSNKLFFRLQTMYLCKFGAETQPGLENRTQNRLNLQVF